MYKNKNDIIFYCTNLRIHTINKKLTFMNNACNAKMTFKINENNFYMNREHNSICNNKNPIIYENLANVTNNVYAFADYKEDLLKYLNLNPLITYTGFKQYAIKKYLSGKFEYNIKRILFQIYISIEKMLNNF